MILLAVSHLILLKQHTNSPSQISCSTQPMAVQSPITAQTTNLHQKLHVYFNWSKLLQPIVLVHMCNQAVKVFVKTMVPLKMQQK